MSRRKALGRRVRRELKTVLTVVQLYCSDQHRAEAEQCPQCAGLMDYAAQRLERCPFGEEKSTCANCTIHCYRPQMREQIREVMRYAGPRMLLRHPILALHHMLDGRRKPPAQISPESATGADRR